MTEIDDKFYRLAEKIADEFNLKQEEYAKAYNLPDAKLIREIVSGDLPSLPIDSIPLIEPKLLGLAVENSSWSRDDLQELFSQQGYLVGFDDDLSAKLIRNVFHAVCDIIKEQQNRNTVTAEHRRIKERRENMSNLTKAGREYVKRFAEGEDVLLDGNVIKQSMTEEGKGFNPFDGVKNVSND